MNIKGNNRFKDKAQSTIEYAILVVCLVAALLAIQIYVKRAIQGRMREASDSIGEQYAPQHVSDSTITITQTGTTIVKATERIIDDEVMGMETTTTTNETTTRTGHEYLEVFEDELFD